MPQWKVTIHSNTSSHFCFVLLWKGLCIGLSVGACVMTTCVYVCTRECLQSLAHHAPFITEHLHTPLPNVRQETVVAQTNSSLNYWLSASHGQNQALSNNTPIKVWHSGRGVPLLGVKCVWFWWNNIFLIICKHAFILVWLSLVSFYVKSLTGWIVC